MLHSNLKELLAEKEISLREFSRVIDYDREAVRKLANNELKNIPAELIVRVCKRLNCEVGDLLEIKLEVTQ